MLQLVQNRLADMIKKNVSQNSQEMWYVYKGCVFL